MRGHKLIRPAYTALVVCITILFLPRALMGIQYPITPQEPVVKTPDNVLKSQPGQSKNKPFRKKAVAENEKQYQVRITLGSGDSVYGIITAPETLSFAHEKNGLSYSKSIAVTDIRQIRIDQYRKKRISEKNEEILFEFEPSRIVIELKTNQRYTVTTLFSFLRKIPIETSEGTTTLYSFFADAWHAKKGWREVESKDKEYHKRQAHPQAAVAFELFERAASDKGGLSKD